MTPYRERREAGEYDAPKGPGHEEEDNGKTKAELQDELHALGLPTSGNKADLEQRLAEAQAVPAEESETGESA